jgi:hypothetical protein
MLNLILQESINFRPLTSYLKLHTLFKVHEWQLFGKGQGAKAIKFRKKDKNLEIILYTNERKN